VHAQQSAGGGMHRSKESDVLAMPVAFVAAEGAHPCSLMRLLCWPRHAFSIRYLGCTFTKLAYTGLDVWNGV